MGSVTPSAVHPKKIAEIGSALLEAKKPLIITSYLGRNKEAVSELVTLAEKLAIPVIESAPNYLNFPADHQLHVGYQWNTSSQNKILAEADLILILDSDVPWIPMINKPSETSKIYYIDEDPLKERIPLWYIPSESFIKADSLTALQQLNDWLLQVEYR